MKKTTSVRISAVALAMLMLLSVLSGCGTQTQTSSAVGAPAGSKTIDFQVVHGDGSTKDFTISTDAETLGEALLAEGLIEGSESEYGLFVTTVDGETADDGAQQWWCLTKGGEEWMNGVDATEISDGDKYEFTLTTGW